MYDTVLKNYLENAVYTAQDAQERLDYAVMRGRITPEEAQQLGEIAALRATKSEASVAHQLTVLKKQIDLYQSLLAWSDLAEGTLLEADSVVLYEGTLYRSLVDQPKQMNSPPMPEDDFWEVLPQVSTEMIYYE